MKLICFKRLPDGKIDRNGWPAILVNRESATCRFTKSNPAVTFPINATHSDMVKFTKGSPLTDVVISKLSKILMPLEDEGQGDVHDRPTGFASVSETVPTSPIPAFQDTLSDTFQGGRITE